MNRYLITYRAGSLEEVEADGWKPDGGDLVFILKGVWIHRARIEDVSTVKVVVPQSQVA